jgi:DNA polymerase-4
MTLEHDIVGARAIVPHLRSAAERVARGLRDEGLLAGGVRVKLKTRTFKLHTRQRVLEQPTDSARPLVEAAEALLGEFDLRSPMRLVGLAAFQLTAETQARQRPLFPDVAHEKRRTLDRLMDSLQDKYGETALRRGEPEE